MTLLVLGLLLWTAAHLFKRLAPGGRAALARTVGAGPSKGVMAAAIGVGLVLIVVGYRGAPVAPVYDPPSWGVHLNNLMMLVAVGLVGLGHSKSRAKGWLRNPMLTGVAVWALAHLLVNGDLASLVLFGWMGVWAVASIAVIDSQATGPVQAAPGSLAGDIRFVVITLVVFAVIAGIHTWLGYPPFPQ
jgi:uncharacterized membrane protein